MKLTPWRISVAVPALALTLACSSSNGTAPAPDAGHPATDGGATPDGASGDAALPSCTVVQSAGGPLEGAASKATCAYEGIPYAAPPVGPLRWKAPQPAAPWTTARPSAAAAGCPQVASEFGTASNEEDCLYLNVWIPNPRPSAASPVMVFVHGGSFLYGSGTYPLYDGALLAAATGHVVVTLNYRLGALGYLSNPALRAEDAAHPSSGEYGIEDQIAAFQWVKTNIAAFGGDPAKVTIFGESAGGTSMFLHLASPKSAGLFSRVIVESGASVGGSPAAPLATADAQGAAFATAAGCTDAPTLLSCLRGKAPADVLTAQGTGDNSNWWPPIDGFIIPSDPLALYAAGTFNKVPTLLGDNTDEGTLFALTTAPTDAASYLTYADGLVPGKGAAIVAEYPVSAYGGSYEAATADILTDAVFVWPARTIARSIAASGTPIFRYHFAHALENPPLSGLGVFHGSEIVFLFQNPIANSFGLSDDEKPLSQRMQSYWGNMATSGAPNGAGLFAWPAYETTTEPQVVLDLTTSTETQYKKAKCDFWDGLKQ